MRKVAEKIEYSPPQSMSIQGQRRSISRAVPRDYRGLAAEFIRSLAANPIERLRAIEAHISISVSTIRITSVDVMTPHPDGINERDRRSMESEIVLTLSMPTVHEP